MEHNSNQDRVDELIKHFWKNGYLTVKRKYGTYLPAPEQIGNYEVDAVGKCVHKYAIGITLSETDLSNEKLLEKLIYLATRHTKYTRQEVLLMIGVPKNLLKKASEIIKQLNPEIQKNIKLAPLEINTLVN